MLNQILDFQREKLEKWTVHFVDAIPPSPMPSTFAYVGTYTLSIPRGKQKYVDNDAAVWYGDTWLTAGQMHRHYLALKYPKGATRLNRSQRALFDLDMGSPPGFSIPTKVPYGFHLDMRAAYWQVVRAFGWDVSYYPGEYIVVSSDVNDFPFSSNKQARNGLVTTSKGSDMQVWTGSGWKLQQAPPPTTNKCLYRLTMDVLNGVAAEMKDRAGAFYVNVDGYIVSADRLDVARAIFQEWGIEWRYQYPPAESGDDPDPVPMTIHHIGDYSNPFKKAHPTHDHFPQHEDKIARFDVGWLKDRFRAFSDYHRGIASVRPVFRD